MAARKPFESEANCVSIRRITESQNMEVEAYVPLVIKIKIVLWNVEPQQKILINVLIFCSLPYFYLLAPCVPLILCHVSIIEHIKGTFSSSDHVPFRKEEDDVYLRYTILVLNVEWSVKRSS